MICELLEKHECLSIPEFNQQFQMKRIPIIISNAFDCIAMEEWNVPYFKDKYIDKTVNLDIYSAAEDEKWCSRTLKLPEALDLICNNTDKSKKHYLMQKSIPEEFPEILPDIQLPKYADKENKYFINLWIGESGIISQAHYDCSDNFLTQIVGRKRARLFPPSESSYMYAYGVDDGLLGDKTSTHISKIQDSDLVSFEEFPNFKHVKCFEGIISPGDLLFIPAGWWHEIKSLDMSMSVNYWWKMKLFDLSKTQATNWICSTFFHFSNNRFSETINTLFDFSEYLDNIEIAEVSLSKNLPCVAAVFLLDYFDKINNNPKKYARLKIENDICEWRKYLAIAKKSDNTLLDDKVILDIIAKIKN